jgi:hypothetical protein
MQTLLKLNNLDLIIMNNTGDKTDMFQEKHYISDKTEQLNIFQRIF